MSPCRPVDRGLRAGYAHFFAAHRCAKLGSHGGVRLASYYTPVVGLRFWVVGVLHCYIALVFFSPRPYLKKAVGGGLPYEDQYVVVCQYVHQAEFGSRLCGAYLTEALGVVQPTGVGRGIAAQRT